MFQMNFPHHISVKCSETNSELPSPASQLSISLQYLTHDLLSGRPETRGAIDVYAHHFQIVSGKALSKQSNPETHRDKKYYTMIDFRGFE
jgi:hypothetical protein